MSSYAGNFEIDVPYKFEPEHIDADPPKYETSGSVGMDLRADIEEDLTLVAGQKELIPTGLHLNIPSGFEAQVRPRSGLTLSEGITVLNSPGTIDQDYRGDIGVILMNTGGYNYTVNPSERIAQLVLAPIFRFNFVDEPLEDSERDDAGFGSTGTQ